MFDNGVGFSDKKRSIYYLYGLIVTTKRESQTLTTLPLHKSFISPRTQPTIVADTRTAGAKYNKAGCPTFM